MSMQSAQEFVQAISANPALLAEVTEATSSPDLDQCATAFAALGKREGFDFTPSEAAETRDAAMESLSESELDQVVGGTVWITKDGKVHTDDGLIPHLANPISPTPSNIKGWFNHLRHG